MLGKTGLLLVEINGNNFERIAHYQLHVQQHIEHGVRILTARKANHDFIAGFNNGKRFLYIPNRLAQFTGKRFYGAISRIFHPAKVIKSVKVSMNCFNDETL